MGGWVGGWVDYLGGCAFVLTHSQARVELRSFWVLHERIPSRIVKDEGEWEGGGVSCHD